MRNVRSTAIDFVSLFSWEEFFTTEEDEEDEVVGKAVPRRPRMERSVY
jgi:hypothetical protein